MTLWDPVYRVKIGNSELTGITLVGLSITRGRSDFNSPTLPGYCQLTLINTSNTNYQFTVNTSVSIEVKDSTGSFVFLFGGRISDLTVEINSAGSTATTTRLNITALGLIARLSRVLFDGALSEDFDGAQIETLLYAVGLDQWNEVSPAEIWSTYPAQTWENAESFFGDIDPGIYDMRSQTLNNDIIQGVINSIAQSAGGYLYEDNLGRICYADAAHRADQLVNFGYTELDARQAIGVGISAVTRQGDVVNEFTVNHGVNFSSSHTSENLSSQALYGLYAQSYNSYLKNTADVIDFADRIIDLRSFPEARFQSITFPLQSPEIGNTTRDALLNIYMGQPIKITNLPANITGGQFEGFVESWTWRSTVNGLAITLTATPTAFSGLAPRWEQVSAAELWNTINPALQWDYAIGVIS